MSGLLLVGGGGEIKKAGTRVVGWSPPDFFLEMGVASPHPGSPHLGEGNWLDAIPTPHTTTPPHLTPHRRGCPRRALFRVLGNPKVFALLLPKNASYDLLRAPRGILAILWGVRGECGGRGTAQSPIPHSLRQTPHLTTHRRGCPRRGLFRVLGNPKVFALLFAKNAS